MSNTEPNEQQPSGADLRAKFEGDLADKDREIAFLKAGIDTETPLGRLFADGYKGDVSPAAVKDAWSQVAPATTAQTAVPDAPAPTEPAPAAPAPTEAAVFDEAGRLANGATAPGGDSGPDPQSAAIEDYWKAKREGKTDRDAEAIGFDRVFDAAHKGDPRAIVASGRKGGD